MGDLLNFSIFKYTILLISILLSSQSELKARSKMMVLSCSKLLNQNQKEKSLPETFSKKMLSCFIKISQEQAQKIFYAKEDSIPLKSEEIKELLNINNLKDFSEEKLKYNQDLLNNFLKEIESPNKRNLEEVDNAEKEANKDDSGDDNKDDININDDAENGDDNNDNDNEFNDMDNDDPNDYGEDMDNEDMYDGGYDDYDDYYDDYYGYGNYSGENYTDDDYSNNYDNQEYYDDDDKPWRVLIKENKGLVVFICCLVVMVILIAIFGKDYEETQTLEIDPNKNKNE